MGTIIVLILGAKLRCLEVICFTSVGKGRSGCKPAEAFSTLWSCICLAWPMFLLQEPKPGKHQESYWHL